MTNAGGESLVKQLPSQKCAELRVTSAYMRAALEIPDHKTHCVLMGEDVIRRLQEQVAT